MRALRLLLPIVLASMVLVAPGHAAATGPGGAGMFVFDRIGLNGSENWTASVDGATQTNLTQSTGYIRDFSPSWAPDGSRIVFSRRVGWGAYTIWVRDAGGGNEQALTATGWDDKHPDWSPQGDKIAFTRCCTNAARNDQIWVMNADGSSQQPLTDGSYNDAVPAWSPGGTQIAIQRRVESGTFHVIVMDADGSDVVDVSSGETSDGHPDWSPDGSRIAYTCGYAICSVKPDGTGRVVITSPPAGAGDGAAAWSPDGSRIAFIRGDLTSSTIYTADIDGADVAPVLTVDQAQSFLAWQPRACTIVGSEANEVLVGTAGPDVICGWGGNDTIYGYGGADVLLGGSGADKLVGGAASDVLVGGAGSDRHLGGSGADLLWGKDLVSRNDIVDGGGGVDVCEIDARDRLRRCP